MSIYSGWHYKSVYVHILSFNKKLLFHSYLFLHCVIYYVCAYYVCVCTGTCTCVCGVQKQMSSVFSYCCLPYCLRQSLSLDLELGLQLTGHRCALPWVASVQGSWDLSLGTHVSTASTVPIELSASTFTLYQLLT